MCGSNKYLFLSQERLGGRTALHLAVEANDASLVSHLAVHCRASPHAINYARLTPYQVFKPPWF